MSDDAPNNNTIVAETARNLRVAVDTARALNDDRMREYDVRVRALEIAHAHSQGRMQAMTLIVTVMTILSGALYILQRVVK